MGTVRGPGLLARLARSHGLVRSPLRRTTDRIEAMVAAVATVLAVLVVPLATVIAMAVCQRELAEAAAVAAQRTVVTAILVTNAEVHYKIPSVHSVTVETQPWRVGHCPMSNSAAHHCWWMRTATLGTEC